MTEPEYVYTETADKQLIEEIADALATADANIVTYEDLAVVALKTFRAYRFRMAEDFAALNRQLGLDQEDDGA